MTSRIAGLIYISWGGLGFYRGIQYYNYHFEEDMKYYLKDPKYHTKPEKFYITQLSYGGAGTIAYVLPFFCVFPAIKELYRLEINLRGLEEEKKKSNYYNLF